MGEPPRSSGRVPFGQIILDASLLRQQPVHGLVEFILGEGVEMEQLAQRAAKGIGMKSAGGGEFGCWLQHASRDHSQDEIAIAVGMLIEEAVETELGHSA